jgi:hypothetical protein
LPHWCLLGKRNQKPGRIKNEPKSEEEQRSSVLSTPKQLEVFLKMNRPNFSELVSAFKGGSSKSAGFQPAKPGNFDGARD